MARTPARAFMIPLTTALAAVLILGPAITASSADLADDPGKVTWAVAPASSEGVDDRPSFAYAVDPGTQIRDRVAVTNLGEQAVTFQVYAEDAITDFDTGAFGLRAAEETSIDLGAWTTPESTEVEVGAGESVIIPFEILVPSDATPGDHSAGIIASLTVDSTDSEGTPIKLEQRVAARIYLRVSGDVAAKVEATGLVAGFSPSWNPFEGGVSTVNYAVTNTGNVRVDVEQKVVIRGPFGIELGTITPKPVENILPGQSAHVVATADGIAPLLILWNAVTLSPKAPTDLVAESSEQTADGSPAEPRPEIRFTPATFEALTGAISWTLLAIFLALIAIIWLVVRYVRVTRERFFDAIDTATEEARQEGREEASAEREPERIS